MLDEAIRIVRRRARRPAATTTRTAVRLLGGIRDDLRRKAIEATQPTLEER